MIHSFIASYVYVFNVLVTANSQTLVLGLKLLLA